MSRFCGVTHTTKGEFDLAKPVRSPPLHGKKVLSRDLVGMEQAELVGIAHVGGEGSTDALNTRNSGFPEHLIPSSWKKLRFVE